MVFESPARKAPLAGVVVAGELAELVGAAALAVVDVVVAAVVVVGAVVVAAVVVVVAAVAAAAVAVAAELDEGVSEAKLMVEGAPEEEPFSPVVSSDQVVPAPAVYSCTQAVPAPGPAP